MSLAQKPFTDSNLLQGVALVVKEPLSGLFALSRLDDGARLDIGTDARRAFDLTHGWQKCRQVCPRGSCDSCAELKDQGFGACETAKRLNIGRASVYRDARDKTKPAPQPSKPSCACRPNTL